MAVKSMPFVIQGCRLIDGNGGKPIDHATVIIEGNRIKRIARGKWIFPGRRGSLEAGGKTVLPGLIDNHVHFGVVSVSGDMRGR